MRCQDFDASIAFPDLPHPPPKNSVPRVPFLSTDLESTSSVGFLDSLPVTPGDLAAAFATKRLTINTDNCTATYHRHSMAMRTDALLSVYAATETSVIELSLSGHLFDDFAKTPVREYARHDHEGTGYMMI